MTLKQNHLKLNILKIIKYVNNIKTVPELAAYLDMPVTGQLLEELYSMKRNKLIIWRTGEYFYLGSKGYEELERSA